MKKNYKKEGFILVELIIVLLAAGALISVSLPDQKAAINQSVHAIDLKIDDGNGATGSLRVFYNTNIGSDEDFCVDSDGVYKLNSNEPQVCNFLLKY
jgi:hypothetical protein